MKCSVQALVKLLKHTQFKRTNDNSGIIFGTEAMHQYLLSRVRELGDFLLGRIESNKLSAQTFNVHLRRYGGI